MHFISYTHQHQPTCGVVVDEQVVNIPSLDPSLSHCLRSLISTFGDQLASHIQSLLKTSSHQLLTPLSEISYLPPIPDPQKLLCVGLNYTDHAKEGNFPIPEHPVFFSRFNHTLVGHNQALIRPKASEKLDYEGELAIIIGKKAHHLTKENATDAVFGYSIFHDATLRDFQVRTPQWTLGKNFDKTGGFGPSIVTKDKLPSAAKGLAIKTVVNGQTVQDSTIDAFIFDVPTLLVALTEVMTLEPGDVIITGTPAGVGFAKKPPLWLKPGDRCEISIEGIGTLVNTVEDER